MAIEIRVPRLGWSMEEGTLTHWLKQEGDFVRKGDAVFVLEGEKATQDIESFDEGVLRLLPTGPQPGEVVRVGQVVALLLAEGEAPPPTIDVTPPAGKPASVAPPPRAALAGGPAARRLARKLQAEVTEMVGRATDDRSLVSEPPRTVLSALHLRTGEPLASPRARRAAVAMGVDLTTLTPSGIGGRIRERDVLAAAGNEAAERRYAPSSVRKTIAQRMLESHLNTAPVTLTTEVDATNLVALREQFRLAAARSEAIVPSFTDFLMKFTALALVEHPALNSRWQDNQVIESAAVHLGLAVDTNIGLLVPVVRNVEQVSLRRLAAQTKELIGRAQSRQLSAEQMQGGTFTLTNLGAYGIDAFTPIIHDRQTAILGIGRIRKLPAVVGDAIVPRDRLALSLTFDHRIVDGAPAARFLQTLSQAIEHPAAWLID
jgi:pyruvate dehydrogenase E2 component (dihydrolipoamide acetyltransferase)